MQRQGLDARGESTCGINRVLRHAAFVQPRFESFVTPRRRYACLLRQIAQVLGMKAGGMRLNSSVRTRAEDAFEVMDTVDCCTADLAADCMP